MTCLSHAMSHINCHFKCHTVKSQVMTRPSLTIREIYIESDSLIRALKSPDLTVMTCHYYDTCHLCLRKLLSCVQADTRFLKADVTYIFWNCSYYYCCCYSLLPDNVLIAFSCPLIVYKIVLLCSLKYLAAIFVEINESIVHPNCKNLSKWQTTKMHFYR